MKRSWMTTNVKQTLASLLLATSLMTAPAEASSLDGLDEMEAYDPWEGFNRSVYEFNSVVDSILLAPVARGYSFITPDPVEDSVSNFIRNLGEPVNFLNALLQGDVDQAFHTFWRFTLNTTMGVAGLFDFASANSDLRYRDEDFGQTLGVWGVGTGPYIVLPIFGPSTTRDAGGLVVDAVSDPWNWMLEWDGRLIRAGVTMIDRRANSLSITDEIEANSLDPYATMRSYYLQYRANQIRNGGNANDPFMTDD